jgi:hypothetical protein
MRPMMIIAAVASLTAGAAFAQFGEREFTKPPAQTKPATPPAGSAANPNTAATLTEAQAKARIEARGFTNVSDLKKGGQGMWTANAMKDGKSVQLSLDARGQVTQLN